MKQQLWILNSSLLGALSALIGIHFLLLEPIPQISLRTPRGKITSEQSETRSPIPQEFIFQNDIFGTFRPEISPVNIGNPITPVPNFVASPVPPPPPIRKIDLIAPLTLTLNGIVLASDQEKCIAMITDETNREGIYHVGDSIKDAFIAKISRNRVVLFRSNGQQETFFLRKEDNILTPAGSTETNKWEYTIKKLDTNQYQIDPRELSKRISSLGSCMEELGIIPAFSAGAISGLRISVIEPESFGAILGLQKGDIIAAVNGIQLSNEKNILKAYEEVSSARPQSIVSVRLMRNNKPVELSCIIKPIDRIQLLNLGSIQQGKELATQPATPPPAELSKPNPEQERAAKRKKVEDSDNTNYYDTIMKIRKRLLENIRSRSPHTRVR